MVRVAWLPRPDVLAIEAACTGLAGVLGVFSPLGLVLHPADPDAELLRLGEDADDWLPQGSSLERGLVLTAQEMKIADDRVAIGAAMP
ncbi:hypothetical protein FB566_0843 [Stackebrandtia endophytica]|uniref:Uncharacterized protein n=2 Tax=Stackebrandtia endophytica TaxID=1496996 RepID=A0A543AS66_9ACTN|nr:hypothetical protein FB566_0843 [Stackebrandtia endophytica]